MLNIQKIGFIKNEPQLKKQSRIILMRLAIVCGMPTKRSVIV